MGLFSFGKSKKSKEEEEAPKMFENIQEKPIGDEDLSFIKTSLHNADLLIDELYKGEPKEKYHPQILDEVFKACLTEIETESMDPSMVQYALGVAFGTFLNNDMGSNWIIYTDDYGTDLTIKFKKGGYAYPLSTVQKRIDSKEVSFFDAIYAAFKKDY